MTEKVFSLVAPDNHWALLAILFSSTFVAIWLEQKYKWAAKISGAIITLVIAIALVNLHVIPAEAPVFDDVQRNGKNNAGETLAAQYWTRKEISLKDIAVDMAFAVVVVVLSKLAGNFFAGLIPTDNWFLKMLNTFFGSQYVWITNFSLIWSTCFEKQASNMRGTEEIGTWLIYLFFFAIGVPAALSVFLYVSQFQHGQLYAGYGARQGVVPARCDPADRLQYPDSLSVEYIVRYDGCRVDPGDRGYPECDSLLRIVFSCEEPVGGCGRDLCGK